MKPKILPRRINEIVEVAEKAGFSAQSSFIRNALAECFDIIGQDTPSRRRRR